MAKKLSDILLGVKKSFTDLIDGLVNGSVTTFDKQGQVPNKTQEPTIVKAKLPDNKIVTAQVDSTPPPTDLPTQNGFDPATVEQKIRKGLASYGGTDSVAYQQIPQFMKAINDIQFYKDNPFLAPQQSILETSAGKYITHKNNLLNYGIKSPQIEKLFSNVGLSDALMRSMKEIGQTGDTYKRFRTGKPLTASELTDYAKTYEPQNPDYPRALIEGLKYFANQ